MARETLVYRPGLGVIPKHEAEPLHDGDKAGYVISDSMDGVRSMADGKMYDSKSRYRAELKARGCIEVGNERQERRTETRPPVRESMRQAIQQLSNR